MHNEKIEKEIMNYLGKNEDNKKAKLQDKSCDSSYKRPRENIAL